MARDSGFSVFRVRVVLLITVLFVTWGLLIGRLYIIQVVNHEDEVEKAARAQRSTRKIDQPRGAIYDTNGYPLVVTVPMFAVGVVGEQVADDDNTRRRVAERLSAPLQMSVDEILGKIDPKSKRNVILRNRLPAAVVDPLRPLIAASRLPGVSITVDPVRNYPEGSIAAQVLGFVGTEGHGLTGLEFQLNDDLAGEPREVDAEQDVHGTILTFSQRVIAEGRPAEDLVLTLDRYVQRTAERVLSEAIQEKRAVGGMIIVMEPSTGGILAIASQPTYTLSDSLQATSSDESLYKVTSITNQYEPGSVMKVITMAAGLDQRVVFPNTTVNDGGVVQIGPDKIYNWDKGGNGVINMTQVLIKSSNVGASFVARALGADRFYAYLQNFGFGKPTGVQLPGEVPGMLRTNRSAGWAPVDLTTNSFGQGIAVTPLQMLSAIAAIGNDGRLMQPSIIRERHANGHVRIVEPRFVREAIKPQTANTVREMMVATYEQPGLQEWRVPGYRLGVKTGTADLPTNLGYEKNRTFASIVALIPAEKPRLAVLIRIDQPPDLYGGRVAAPVLQRLALDLVRYYRIPPQR
jgi:cell division protein FtsI/penicillin-binding protein 2